MRKSITIYQYSTVSVIILIIIQLIGCAAPINQALVDPSVKQQLTQEILDLDKLDQQYRWQIIFGETDVKIIDSLLKLPSSQMLKNYKKPTSPDYPLPRHIYDSITTLQSNLDNIVREKILYIYKKYGWPGRNLVSPKATGIATLALIHFPDPIKKRLYPKLKKEYKNGHIQGKDLALMYDKLLLSQQKPLLYGMFMHYDSVSRTSLPPEIRNIEQTNNARKALGLEPLSKYRISQK
jgi:hypothetical protein